MKRVGTVGSVVLGVLAFAVPAEVAVRPDDRSGARGVAAATAVALVRPDDRAGLRGAGVTSLSTSVRPDDRAGIRGVAQGSQSAAVGTDSSVRGTDGGFAWGAAIAGAGAATAALLFVAWTLTLRRNRRAEVADLT